MADHGVERSSTLTFSPIAGKPAALTNHSVGQSLFHLQQHHVDLNQRGRLLITNGKMPNGKRIKILIDSGAFPSFISSKHTEYTPGKQNLKINLAGNNAHLYGAHHKKINFDVLQNSTLLRQQHNFVSADIQFDIILGMDWLQQHNPQIDFSTNTLTFKDNSSWLCDAARPLCETISAATFSQDYNNEQIFGIFLNETHAPPTPPPTFEHSSFAADDKDRAAYAALPPDIRSIIDDYPSVFEPLGDTLPPRRDCDHKIELKDESAPPPFAPIYHMDEEELKSLREELEFHKSRIRPSKSAYGAPCFFVKQKNKLRLVIDYRRLNSQTIKNRTPLPNIPEMLDRLQNAVYFTKIDLASGFHQVRVAEGHEHKTAFRTKYGSYEWLVLPLGLTNSPATFQTMVNTSFSDFLDDFVTAFVDDFCIFSKSYDEHIAHLRKVLARMQQHQLHARLHKCTFFSKELDNYVGYHIKNGTISVLPSRLTAIRDFEPPTTWSELRGFIGLANTLHRFVKNQAAILAPLTDLLRTGNNRKDQHNFVFTQKDLQNFNSVKAALSHPSTLSMFDSSRDVHLYTDWSKSGISSYVCQPDLNGVEHPISFGSRKCNPSEAKYHPYAGEILALVEGLKTHRHYLVNTNVKVFTDHDSLKNILSQPKLKAVQHRWLSDILSFDFTVEWTPGTWNKIADILSRRSHTQTVSTQTDENPPIPKDDSAISLNTISSLDITNDILDQIKNFNQNDDEYLEISQHLVDPDDPESYNDDPPPIPKHLVTKIRRYLLRNSLLYYRADNDLRLFVPFPLRKLLISLAHDSGPAIHNNWERTAERITRNYHWPRLHHDVKAYVRHCDACQRNKIARRLPYGLLNPHNVPISRWDTISMDFITKLPPTSQNFDAIMVIVDSASKRVHINPCRTTDTAHDIATLFERTIWRNHGLPRHIISDRDSKFISAFWTSLMQSLRITHNMSTSYHPQTDGQTEIRNPWIQAVLRGFVNHHQDDWDQYLHIIEHGINDSVNSTTGYTPFMLDTGKNPTSLLDLSLTPYDRLSIRDFQAQYESAKSAIRDTQDKYAALANRKRQEHPFKIGSYVLIHASDFTPPNQTSRPSTKLSPIFHGPYKIISQHGTSFKLQFPSDYRMHPIFHPDKLRPYYWDSEQADPLSTLPLQTRIIDSILSRRFLNGQDQVLVQWKDHHPVHNIWLELTPALINQLRHSRISIPSSLRS